MDLYEMYVRDGDDFAEVKKFILREFTAVAKEIKVYEDTEHTLRVGSDVLNVHVSDKVSDVSSRIAFIGEEYNMELDYHIQFDQFYEEDESRGWKESDRQRLKLMEAVIRKNEEDCIVLFNGCQSVLERRNNVIVADGRYLRDLDVEYTDRILEE